MLKGFSALQILFLNILVIGVWHVSVFIACIKLPPSYFDCNKSRFRPREWERGGRWYRDKLKINVWKDKVPQHVGKDGFSKSHITDVSIEYLDQLGPFLQLFDPSGEPALCSYPEIQPLSLVDCAQETSA